MLLAQQFHDFLIPAGSTRTVTKSLASLPMPQSIRHGYAPAKSGERAIMTALDPACPENAAEAPSPKWTQSGSLSSPNNI